MLGSFSAAQETWCDGADAGCNWLLVTAMASCLSIIYAYHAVCILGFHMCKSGATHL